MMSWLLVLAGLLGSPGAVPILLGSFLLDAPVEQSERLYGIVVVVVVFSVVVQGGLLPLVADRLRLPMRTVEPEPFALGVRLRDEPEGARRFTVSAGSSADGRRLQDLHDLPADVWVSFAIRDQRLLPTRADTRLQTGDEVLVLADAADHDELRALFEQPRRDPAGPATPDAGRADGPPGTG